MNQVRIVRQRVTSVCRTLGRLVLAEMKDGGGGEGGRANGGVRVEIKSLFWIAEFVRPFQHWREVPGHRLAMSLELRGYQ